MQIFETPNIDLYCGPNHTCKVLGNTDHIESSLYVQDISAYRSTLSGHKNELLRVVLSELQGL